MVKAPRSFTSFRTLRDLFIERLGKHLFQDAEREK